MENEIKFVTRQETFDDLAVRELAKNKAACICRLQFSRCKIQECHECEVGKRLANCMKELSDYNKLRLDSYTAAEYMSLSRNPNNWRTHKSFIAHYIGFVVVILLFLLLILIPIGIAGPQDRPSSKPFDSQIIDIREAVNNIVWDLDKDGRIDCCDHAILFKLLWDIKYPALKDKCEIIRNFNPGIMNHLFIGIRMNNSYIFVEPWATQSYYDMDIVWGSQYDMTKNSYGETKRWLETIR